MRDNSFLHILHFYTAQEKLVIPIYIPAPNADWVLNSNSFQHLHVFILPNADGQTSLKIGLEHTILIYRNVSDRLLTIHIYLPRREILRIDDGRKINRNGEFRRQLTRNISQIQFAVRRRTELRDSWSFAIVVGGIDRKAALCRLPRCTVSSII